MKKRRLGQTGSWSVTFTISLALFNLGLFGILLISGNQLTQMVRQNFEVQIFMHQDFDPAQVPAIAKMLAQKPYTARDANGASGVRFTGKQEAGLKFMKETGEDFIRFLGENPLRDAFSVKIQQTWLDDGRLKEIKKDMETIPGVFEVIYMESLAGSIRDNVAKVSLIFLVVSGLLLISVTWLIRNAIRLLVYSRRFLIRSMVLVGAEPWFIRKPFVYKMIRQGFYGGLLASLVLAAGMEISARYYEPLRLVFAPLHLGLLLGGLMLFGSVLGGVSAWLSVRKYSFQKLDDLHFYG